MIVNLFLALRDDAQDLIVERLNWDNSTPYTGPVPDRIAKLFHYMQNRGQVQGQYKTYVAGARSYKNWSITLEGSQKLKDEVDFAIATYPAHIIIIGAWHWDGRMIGTQFVYDDVTRDVEVQDPDAPQIPNPDYQPDPELPDYDPIEMIDDVTQTIIIQVTSNEIVGTSGTPTYPIHAQILKIMPDVVTYDVNGNEISRVDATEPTDVNLLMGQAPRRFT
jgi:hypothetical protein